MHPQLAMKIRTSIQGKYLYQALLVLTGSVLLAAAAHLKVPFWPVPMTMQSLIVMLMAATLGTRFAGLTVLVYLLEGAVGLPVFAGGGGLLYMAGPTGGYLIGFLLAAILMGTATDKGWGRGLLGCLALLLAGDIVIFALGTAWLASLIGLSKAVAGGVLPFLPGEAVKIALACAGLMAATRLVRR